MAHETLLCHRFNNVQHSCRTWLIRVSKSGAVRAQILVSDIRNPIAAVAPRTSLPDPSAWSSVCPLHCTLHQRMLPPCHTHATAGLSESPDESYIVVWGVTTLCFRSLLVRKVPDKVKPVFFSYHHAGVASLRSECLPPELTYAHKKSRKPHEVSGTFSP